MLIQIRYPRTTAVILCVIFMYICHRDSKVQKVNKSLTNKVLIVSSNPRSGSTYLADMISRAEIDGLFISEPLRWLVKKEEVQNGTEQEERLPLLRNFFRCQFQENIEMMLEEVSRRFYFRRPKLGLGVDGRLSLTMLTRVMSELEEACDRSRLRVVKTIRLFLEELQDEDLDEYKVILLIRDPRAVIASILAGFRSDWRRKQKIPNFVCEKALRDLEAFRKMENNNNNVILVQYENLIDRRESEMRRIFEDFLKIGVPVSHLGAEKEDGYFGTWREAGFRHDSWKTKANLGVLRNIEGNEACRKVMDTLGYQPI